MSLSYAIITAELPLNFHEDVPHRPSLPLHHVLVGDPAHPHLPNHTPAKFTLADDDGVCYYHGLLFDDHSNDLEDVTEYVFQWGQQHGGTTILAKGHQRTKWRSDGEPSGPTSVRDQVIS